MSLAIRIYIYMNGGALCRNAKQVMQCKTLIWNMLSSQSFWYSSRWLWCIPHQTSLNTVTIKKGEWCHWFGFGWSKEIKLSPEDLKDDAEHNLHFYGAGILKQNQMFREEKN